MKLIAPEDQRPGRTALGRSWAGWYLDGRRRSRRDARFGDV